MLWILQESDREESDNEDDSDMELNWRRLPGKRVVVHPPGLENTSISSENWYKLTSDSEATFLSWFPSCSWGIDAQLTPMMSVRRSVDLFALPECRVLKWIRLRMMSLPRAWDVRWSLCNRGARMTKWSWRVSNRQVKRLKQTGCSKSL